MDYVVWDDPVDDDTIKLGYDNLLKSGMFWEFYPTLTGVWGCDKARYMRYITKLAYKNIGENI